MLRPPEANPGLCLNPGPNPDNTVLDKFSPLYSGNADKYDFPSASWYSGQHFGIAAEAIEKHIREDVPCKRPPSCCIQALFIQCAESMRES